MAEWISVKDRLPNKDTEVLCCSVRGDLFIGKYLEAIYTEDVYVFVDTNRWDARSVTHWMPLPEPPKGE
jgi:hypothetical protein